MQNEEKKVKMRYWGTKISVDLDGVTRVLYTKDRVFANALVISLQNSGYQKVRKEPFYKVEKK